MIARHALKQGDEVIMLNYQDICSQVCDVLAPFAKEGQVLSEGTELVADLGLDSVQVMELLLKIEDHFDVSIPLNVLPDVRTIKDLCLQLDQITKQAQ